MKQNHSPKVALVYNCSDKFSQTSHEKTFHRVFSQLSCSLIQFHLCYIHSSCHYDPLNKIMLFVLVNSTQVFQKGFYYRGFWWLCMRNSLLILMEFRNKQQYSDSKYSTCIFRTSDIKCSFVCLNFVLFRIIQIACFCCVFCFFRFIQFVLLYNKKNKGPFNGLQKKIKRISTRLSFEVPGSIQKYFYVVLLQLLCCSIILYF